MKIGIFPKIVETYKNQFELCLDIRFKKFFEKTFPDYSTNLIFSHKEVKEYDLIVIAGGNNLKLSKKQIEIKQNAFKKYTTEIMKYPHPRSKEGIINLARYRGQTFSTSFAESFYMVRLFVD